MATNAPPWMPPMTVTMYGAAPWAESPRVPDAPWALPTFAPLPVVTVQPPPSYAPKSELEIIDALEKLPDDQRRRVLRFATDKWPTVELETLKKRAIDAEAAHRGEIAQRQTVERDVSGYRAEVQALRTELEEAKKPTKRRAKR